MKDRPFFQCRFDTYCNSDGTPHEEVCGQFQVGIPSAKSTHQSTFGNIVQFQYDSGSELSVMSKQYAIDYGLEQYEQHSLGECWIRGYDHDVPARKGHRVPLWIRFRHHRMSALTHHQIKDGIPDWEFQFLFLIVDDADMECPLLGVNDMHRFFQLSTRKDYYYFFQRVPTDTDLPRNWDPQATPKRIRPLR